MCCYSYSALFSSSLQNFYNEIEKEELYIRYIYKLAELHERDDNFTEAGFTLLLHAENLEVSDCSKCTLSLSLSLSPSLSLIGFIAFLSFPVVD